jgi:hypothetical protein
MLVCWPADMMNCSITICTVLKRLDERMYICPTVGCGIQTSQSLCVWGALWDQVHGCMKNEICALFPINPGHAVAIPFVHIILV